MRQGLSEVSTIIGTASVAVWIAVFNDEKTSTWLYVVPTFFVLAVATKIVIYIPRRGRGNGPDFRLTWRSPQLWELERLRRTTAESVRQGDGIIATTDIRLVGERAEIGDLPCGKRVLIGLPNDDGANVPLCWREASQWFYAKSVYLAKGLGPFEITGIPWKAGEEIQT